MVERELDELVGHRSLGDPVRLEPARLAGHAGNVEASAAREDGVVGVSQRSRPEPVEVVEDRLAQQLDSVAREEERHLVAGVDSRLPDEEAESCSGRMLGAVRYVDEDLRHARIVDPLSCRYLAETLGSTRIQLCGRVTVELDGRRVEDELPGRQGRLLFVYLAAQRSRPATRDELLEAVWPGGASTDALSPLLSRLRRVVPLEGRSTVQLALPADAWIDLEAATEALHRAESAIARDAWEEAWGPARVPQHVCARGFLPGEDAPWIAELRRRVEELYLRSLELVARAGVGIGGAELDTAERAARRLVELAPYRESGYRALMETLARRGNSAEALVVYDGLRTRLRADLGTAPSTPTQKLHRELLG
ncbi:MAG: family transcriptional regulator, regulator of embCAB operon [Gaiellaceae bacterium]|nr:family transcriptional regulator, regulator of embCAB operon [Gaiellaceae bacterium]